MRQPFSLFVSFVAPCLLGATAITASAAAASAVDASVDVLPVRPGLDMVIVNGENVAVQFGPDGAVVVDTGAPADSAALVAAIKRITPQPIRYIINTSASLDRTGGNAAVATAGHAFSAGENGISTGGFVKNFNAPIIAQANVSTALSATLGSGDSADAALPSIIYDYGQKNFSLNDQAIEVIGEPNAHSDSDSVVLFRGADVLVAGDILDMEHFPRIDVAHGGSINGEIAALNHIIDLVVPVQPLYWHPGGTLVIPARGRIGEQEEVVQYRDMVTIVRDRVQALLDQHRTLAQIRAADPTAGFKSRYGADSGPWTTDQFVASVYQSLTAHASRKGR
jgi:cyclase